MAEMEVCVLLAVQVLASFQQQLAGLNSEKDQRGLIKTLLAETGVTGRGAREGRGLIV
jgi:hypothetical protein